MEWLRTAEPIDEEIDEIEDLPPEDDVNLWASTSSIRTSCPTSRRGCLIGSNDMFIAAHALSLGATLVTANVREFERIDGLVIENWLHPV